MLWTFLIVLVFIYILYQLEQNDADDKLLNNLKAVVRRMSVNIEINRLFRHLWKHSLVQVSEAVKSDPARRQQCQVDHTLYHRFKWSVLRTSTDAYELLYTNRNRKKNKKLPIEFYNIASCAIRQCPRFANRN